MWRVEARSAERFGGGAGPATLGGAVAVSMVFGPEEARAEFARAALLTRNERERAVLLDRARRSDS